MRVTTQAPPARQVHPQGLPERLVVLKGQLEDNPQRKRIRLGPGLMRYN